jgi:hypothetical protein
MTESIEKQVLGLIATDRVYIPVSSMDGKLKRTREKLAKGIDLTVGDSFEGERTYAHVDTTDKMKARGMRAGIVKFAEEFPRHGTILNGYIEEQRALSETHLTFGMYDGCRITSDDYMNVMTDLGFSEGMAGALYPELMNVSRKLSRARPGEERSILIG